MKVLSNKGRFIKAILDNKIEVRNRPKTDLIYDITNLGLDKLDESYDYLLKLPIWSLTKEVFEKLKDDYKLKKQTLEDLEKIEPKNMYLDDLSELKKKLKSN